MGTRAFPQSEQSFRHYLSKEMQQPLATTFTDPESKTNFVVKGLAHCKVTNFGTIVALITWVMLPAHLHSKAVPLKLNILFRQ